MNNNPHAGHRERVRAEFIANPINEHTPPHKILEFLLFYSIPRRDTNEIAHALMNKFHTLSNVFDATSEELLSVDGVGESTVALLKNLLPVARLYEADKSSAVTKLSTFEEMGNYILKKYIGITDEHLSMLCLDNRGKILGFEFLAKGDIESVGVSTRKIIAFAMRCNATSCVLAHNHPGGIAIPSNEDLIITASVKKTLFDIGVRLIDHIIIANSDFVSMRLSRDYSYLFK